MNLKRFIDVKKKELKILKKNVPLNSLKRFICYNKKTRNFLEAFKTFGIIAEIKRASPSKGIIDKNSNIIDIAKDYEKGGAAAISVLTEKEYFKGDISYLKKVKNAVNLPILRKDFIIDEYQVYESKINEADAILLIAGILSRKKLEKFVNLAHELGMECLVEVHDKKELEIALSIESIKIIGVNNRDLNTLKTDFSVLENLIELIPKSRIIISESGVNSKEDMKRIKALGANGALIGTSLMKSNDKIIFLRNLLT